MNSSRPFPFAVCLIATAILGGCASEDLLVSASRPGKYNLYGCDQLNARGTQIVKRELELRGLMQKAGQDAGGRIATALAYQNEYNVLQGDLLEIEASGARKSCVLKHRSVSDQIVR